VDFTLTVQVGSLDPGDKVCERCYLRARAMAETGPTLQGQ
jgi:hypothetical protein